MKALDLPQEYSRSVRALHALLALAVVFELAVSRVMDHPHGNRPMSVPGGRWFHWHEWIGLAALAILTLSWLYRFATWKRESQGRIFPWTSREGRAALRAELRDFLRLRWNALPEHGALSGTGHGLGLLIASAMAATGCAIYLMLGPDERAVGTVHQLMDVHSFLSNFMWAYLVGHAILALWHQLAGHRTLERMFSLGNR
jgi:cytochrome b561